MQFIFGRVHLALKAYQELLLTLDMMDRSRNPQLMESSKVIKSKLFIMAVTGSDGAVAKSLVNGLVGTGFASWYRLQPTAGLELVSRYEPSTCQPIYCQRT